MSHAQCHMSADFINHMKRAIKHPKFQLGKLKNDLKSSFVRVLTFKAYV